MIRIQVTDETVTSNHGPFKAKVITAYDGETVAGLAIVDAALIPRWGSWLQDETKAILNLIAKVRV